MRIAELFPSNCQSLANSDLGLCQPGLILQDSGKVAKEASSLRMVVSETPLHHSQPLPIAKLRLAELAFHLEQDGKVIETCGKVRMVIPYRFSGDVHSFTVQLLCLR